MNLFKLLEELSELDSEHFVLFDDSEFPSLVRCTIMYQENSVSLYFDAELELVRELTFFQQARLEKILESIIAENLKYSLETVDNNSKTEFYICINDIYTNCKLTEKYLGLLEAYAKNYD